MKLKIATWADFMYIFTFLYIVFCLCIYCIPLQVEMKVFGKEIGDITVAQYWNLTNSALKGFKFTLMIFGCGAACLLIDCFITKPFFNRFTKAGKLARLKVKKEYMEMEKQNV